MRTSRVVVGWSEWSEGWSSSSTPWVLHWKEWWIYSGIVNLLYMLTIVISTIIIYYYHELLVLIYIYIVFIMNVILLYSLLLLSVGHLWIIPTKVWARWLALVQRNMRSTAQQRTGEAGWDDIWQRYQEVPTKKIRKWAELWFFWTFVCFCQNEVSRVGKKNKKTWITWICWTQKLHWHLKKLLDSADRFNSYQTPMEAMSSGPSPGGHWHRKKHRRLGLHHIPSGKRLHNELERSTHL
jgi:hypothetical protein